MASNLRFRKILTAVRRMEWGRLLLEGVQLGGNCSSGRKEVSESKVLPSIDRGFLRDLDAEAVISTDNRALWAPETLSVSLASEGRPMRGNSLRDVDRFSANVRLP